jgi:hypothetical protein
MLPSVASKLSSNDAPELGLQGLAGPAPAPSSTRHTGCRCAVAQFHTELSRKNDRRRRHGRAICISDLRRPTSLAAAVCHRVQRSLIPATPGSQDTGQPPTRRKHPPRGLGCFACPASRALQVASFRAQTKKREAEAWPSAPRDCHSHDASHHHPGDRACCRCGRRCVEYLDAMQRITVELWSSAQLIALCMRFAPPRIIASYCPHYPVLK